MAVRKVFYAIDMGSPSSSGGFFCWRWEDRGHHEDNFTAFDRHEGWYESIRQIANDYEKGHKIYMTIEAPLSGGKSRQGRIWEPRFSIKIGNSEARENAWYGLAGASTGYMTQEFIYALRNSMLEKKTRKSKKIELYESYVSGLQSSAGKILKPNKLMRVEGMKKDQLDAYECLVMLIKKVHRAPSTRVSSPNGNVIEFPAPKQNRIRYHQKKYEPNAILNIAKDVITLRHKREDLLIAKNRYVIRRKAS